PGSRRTAFSPPIASTLVRYHGDRAAPRCRVPRRSAWRRTVVAGACMAAAGTLISGCGEAPNPPVAIVQSYLNTLGGGEYAAACGMVDDQALATLMRAKHVHMACANLF